MKDSESWDIEIISYKETDSTQTRAKEFLKAYKKPPFCIAADMQTGGYGQAGRPYYCPHGGLYISFVLDESDLQYKFAAGFVTVCIVQVLQNHMHPSDERCLSIKWINDIHLDGKKVGGVLIEKTGSCFIIGIGLNIIQTETPPPELKERIAFLSTTKSTANSAHFGYAFASTHELICQIITRILSAKLTDEQVLAEYKKYCDISGLNIDGSLDTYVDGKLVKKFNNL